MNSKQQQALPLFRLKIPLQKYTLYKSFLLNTIAMQLYVHSLTRSALAYLFSSL